MIPTLFLEEDTPELRKIAIRFLNKQTASWRVVTPLNSNWNPTSSILKVQNIYELINNLNERIFQRLPRVIQQLSTAINSYETSQVYQNVFQTSLNFIVTPVVTSQILSETIPNLQVIVTKKRSIHKILCNSSFQFLTPNRVIDFIKCIVSILKSFLDLLLNVFKNIFYPVYRSIHQPKVGFIAGPRVEEEHIEKIFSDFNPQEIYIHVLMESSSKNDLTWFLNLATQKNWSFEVYKNRNLLRSFYQFLKIPFVLYRLCLRANQIGFYYNFEKFRLIAIQKQWEISDLLLKTNIRVLITSSERDPLGFIIADEAVKHKCKTVNVFNGYIHEKDTSLCAPPFDAYFIWNSRQKKIFRNLGVPEENLHITGHLNDQLYLDIIQKRSRLNRTQHHIVYFSQYGAGKLPLYRGEISAILKELLNKNPHLELTIKLHPAENDGLINREWDGIERCKIVTTEISALELLSWADFAVGAYSTTLIESLAVGIPIAVYDTTGLMAEFVQAGVALDLVSSTKRSVDIINILKNMEKYNQLSEKAEKIGSEFLGIKDGKSMKRMAEIIHPLAS